MKFQEALEFLTINRFAIMTFEQSMLSENDYSCLLQEQATIRIRCVMCCKNNKVQVVRVGGREDLTSIHLRNFCESIMEKVAASTPPYTVSVGISSIAQDPALLPQLIAESTRAVGAPASETISKLQDAVWQIKSYIEKGYQEDLTLQSM